jgi:hypothetical protein
MPVLDGAASVLIGEGVDREMAAAIRKIATGDQSVTSAAAPLTMYFGPDNILLTLDVEFEHGVSGADVAAAVGRIEKTSGRVTSR